MLIQSYLSDLAENTQTPAERMCHPRHLEPALNSQTHKDPGRAYTPIYASWPLLEGRLLFRHHHTPAMTIDAANTTGRPTEFCPGDCTLNLGNNLASATELPKLAEWCMHSLGSLLCSAISRPCGLTGNHRIRLLSRLRCNIRARRHAMHQHQDLGVTRLLLVGQKLLCSARDRDVTVTSSGIIGLCILFTGLKSLQLILASRPIAILGKW